MDVTGVILAGGKSTRFGRNKALELVLGKTLVQYVYDCLQPLAAEIYIVTSKELAGLPYPAGAVVLTDIYPERGPLAGIYTGLERARCDYGIAVGCDMPFLNKELLRYMVGECRGFDAVAPRINRSRIEPLHTVYAKRCLEKMKSRLETGELQINFLFRDMKVKYIGRQICRKFDPELNSFLNINTQNDLEKAILLARDGVGEGKC